MARERERVDLGPLMLTDLSNDGARCLLEGLSLEFEIAILSYEADMSPSRGNAPWGSMRICTVFDLSEADPAAGSIVCCSCWQLVSPLKRLLAGNAPVSPLGLLLARRLLVAPSDAGPTGMVVKGCVRDACSSVSGRRGDPWRVFALAMRMRFYFRRPQCEAFKAHVGHARAYRGIFNDALAALSIIRCVRRLRTLLVMVPSPRGVFDLTGSILLSLEFARAKGSKDSTSECVVFCLRRGVASAAPLFVGLGFVLSPVYLLETPRLCIAWSLWCALPYLVRVGPSWRFGFRIFGSRTSRCSSLQTLQMISPIV
ncbi:hypothetical protein CRG98_016325 [Punica granatum]|uniref:Uncharacterized protein n=1 Tax=Punica granatum TaxID=22663 RepID=A0A2I0K556_PUNGR|nr:hypothetical protein CRG98_016325 [Punica granatum]